jgi:hypothetical protein
VELLVDAAVSELVELVDRAPNAAPGTPMAPASSPSEAACTTAPLSNHSGLMSRPGRLVANP